MPRNARDQFKKIRYLLAQINKNPKSGESFAHFLASPLHRNSPRSAEIFKILCAALQLPTDKTEAYLLAHLIPHYGDLAKARRRLQRLLNPILEAYYDFVALKHFQKSPSLKWRFVIQAINLPEQDQYFPWIYKKKALKSIEEAPRTANHFLEKMLLADQLDVFQSRQKISFTPPRQRYHSELQALDHYYAAQLLKIACDALNQEQLTHDYIPISPPLLSPLLAHLKETLKHHPPLIQIYYRIFICLQTPTDVTNYRALKSLILKRYQSISQPELYKIAKHLTNYCARQTNLSKDKQAESQSVIFQDELLELYIFFLEKGILYQERNGVQYIEHGNFKNILNLFLKMGKTAQVAKFIEEYNSKILAEFRKPVHKFFLAMLHFALKDFSLALSDVNQAFKDLSKIPDRHLVLSIRSYRLRILYELGKYEICEMSAKSLARSIRYNKHLPNSNTQKTLQFCLYLAQLCKTTDLPQDMATKALGKLSAQIQNGPATISMPWLFEKIAELGISL